MKVGFRFRGCFFVGCSLNCRLFCISSAGYWDFFPGRRLLLLFLLFSPLSFALWPAPMVWDRAGALIPDGRAIDFFVVHLPFILGCRVPFSCLLGSRGTCNIILDSIDFFQLFLFSPVLKHLDCKFQFDLIVR